MHSSTTTDPIIVFGAFFSNHLFVFPQMNYTQLVDPENLVNFYFKKNAFLHIFPLLLVELLQEILQED